MVNNGDKQEIIYWKGSFALFVIAFLVLLGCTVLPWYHQSGNLKDPHTSQNIGSFTIDYRLFGTDYEANFYDEEESASQPNIGSMNRLQFILFIMAIVMIITILLYLRFLVKMGRSKGQEGHKLSISLTILTLIIPIMTLILIYWVGEGGMGYSGSYGNTSFFPSIGFFGMFVVFIFMVVGVVKWNTINVMEMQSIQQKAQTQLPPANSRPSVQSVKPVIPPLNVDKQLDMLLNANLSKDVKEKELLKLFLDDKITKEQFYDMKRKL